MYTYTEWLHEGADWLVQGDTLLICFVLDGLSALLARNRVTLSEQWQEDILED